MGKRDAGNRKGPSTCIRSIMPILQLQVPKSPLYPKPFRWLYPVVEAAEQVSRGSM